MQLISLFLIRQLYKYNSLYVYVYATYYENNNNYDYDVTDCGIHW